MTIAVACNLADGLIIGADSAVTVQGAVNTPQGRQEGILKVYNDAEKVFSFYSLPVGIVTYGLSLLKQRTIQSYIRQFEHEHTVKDVLEWKLEKIANEIWTFFNDKYRESFASALEEKHQKGFDEIPTNDRPGIGFMIGGYSPGEYLSELWEVNVHSQTSEEGVHVLRSPGTFGSNWRGEIEGVRRLHKGFSFQHLDAVISNILDFYNVEMQPELLKKIQTIVNEAEYQIPWDGMPLQEGIDYVKFCLDIMINQTKFVIGAPTCGGNVRLAVIQHDRFEEVTDTDFAIRTF